MKKMQEIDLGSFVKTKGIFTTEPYAIWFVYTPEGNFLVKGMSNLCKEYVEKNFSKYIARYTMWQKGKSRGSWVSCKGLFVNLIPRHDKYGMIDYKKRLKYRIGSSKTENFLEFRKIPNKWLPEYDKLLAGNGFQAGSTYECELVSDYETTTYDCNGNKMEETFVAGKVKFKVINLKDYPFLKDNWEEKSDRISIQLEYWNNAIEIVPCIPVSCFRNIKKV